MDKRVIFDFEVDFTNGGGIQGQEFRLDIEGDDISDEELAKYIVKDMRLLMVDEVRILHKKLLVRNINENLLRKIVKNKTLICYLF